MSQIYGMEKEKTGISVKGEATNSAPASIHDPCTDLLPALVPKRM